MLERACVCRLQGKLREAVCAGMHAPSTGTGCKVFPCSGLRRGLRPHKKLLSFASQGGGRCILLDSTNAARLLACADLSMAILVRLVLALLLPCVAACAPGGSVSIEAISSPQGSPDLVASSSGGFLSPSVLVPGASLLVSLDVDNNGNVAAGAFDVGFYASTNTVISNTDILLGRVSVSGVAAGGTASVSQSFSTAALQGNSSYYVGWIIDEAGQVPESNLGNNVGYFLPPLSTGGTASSYSVTTTPLIDPLSAPYTYFSPSRTVLFDGQLGTYDDDYASIGAPFPIRFFGQSVNSLFVSTNGFVNFGSSSGASYHLNMGIPTGSTPNGFAAVFWDDLVVGETTGASGATLYGEISYEVLGASPDRSLKIEFANLRKFLGSGYLYGQLWIHEQPAGVNSVLELVYPTQDYGAWIDVSATIGIESPSGASGYEGPSGSPLISSKPSSSYRFQ